MSTRIYVGMQGQRAIGMLNSPAYSRVLSVRTENIQVIVSLTLAAPGNGRIIYDMGMAVRGERTVRVNHPSSVLEGFFVSFP